MELIGIIGGSGLSKMQGLETERQEVVETPYGEPSAPLSYGHFGNHPVVFVPRHGAEHSIPPHKVNYRANIWAMRYAGANKIIGMAAVGGITQPPDMLCIPDQIIDYTWGREHTYFDTDLSAVVHVDFTEPYCEELRQALIRAAQNCGVPVVDGGTYGATQGPRLETSMEIDRMQQDGCDLVGMTGMPEAALARELGLCYASCAVVVNWAAGKTEGPITMEEIEGHLKSGMGKARSLLAELRL